MRFILSLSILAVCLSFTSCTKQRIGPDLFDDQINEVISMAGLIEMRQAQAMLSVAQREKLWDHKLKFILNNRNEKFTADQRRIVQSLYNLLMQHGMQKLMNHPEIGISFLNENEAYFNKHFSKEQLNILIESPMFHENLLISSVTISTMAELLYVEGGSPCMCIYDWGCPGPNNNCEVEGCTAQNDVEMCGVFGTSSCKKRCEGLQP